MSLLAGFLIFVGTAVVVGAGAYLMYLSGGSGDDGPSGTGGGGAF